MKNILLAIALSILAPAAFAIEGSVCITEAKVGTAVIPVDARTKFSCENTSEKKTISELYKAGWTVAHILPQTFFEGTTVYAYWMLVIEKK